MDLVAKFGKDYADFLPGVAGFFSYFSRSFFALSSMF